jgi:hypothetical protein
MVQKIFLPLLLLCQSLHITAQTEAAKTKPLQINCYVGLQANQLVKQLLNLSNSPAISNPYLLTAAVTSYKYFGISLRGGIGYNYSKITELSPATHESKLHEIFFRYGIGKNFLLGTKWEASIGVDRVEEYKVNKTFATSVTIFSSTTDSVESVTTSKTETEGYGGQLALAFHLSKHVLLGTEATFYYVTSHIKQNSEVFENITNTSAAEENIFTYEATNSEAKEVSFNATAPVALFLIVKF